MLDPSSAWGSEDVLVELVKEKTTVGSWRSALENVHNVSISLYLYWHGLLKTTLI